MGKLSKKMFIAVAGGKRNTLPAWATAGGIARGNCVAAYQPVGAASYAASLINLAKPGTYNLTEAGTSPGWNATDGWTNDGTASKYFLTGINPHHDWTVICRCSLSGTVYSGLFGLTPSPGNVYSIQVYSPYDRTNYQNKSNTEPAAIQFDDANLPHQTWAMNGTDCYLDGVDIADMAGLYDSATGDMRIMNSVDNDFTGKFYAIAIYNVSLTTAQILAVHTAMVALP